MLADRIGVEIARQNFALAVSQREKPVEWFSDAPPLDRTKECTLFFDLDSQ